MDVRHRKIVADIARTVRSFYDEKRSYRVYHGSTNSTRPQSFDHTNMVDVSRLNRVLSIDVVRMTALVEPNVAMDRLVATTRRKSLVPQVVMEFPGITVGGALQGGAGESSSYRYGLFNRTLNWYEMILPDGSVVVASPTENPDLYYATAGSYGTLGIVTAAEVQLVVAKPYVVLDYIGVRSFDEAVMTIDRCESQNYDYLDGIMFSATHGIVIAGRLADQPVGPVRRFLRPHDDWFYLDAEHFGRAGHLSTQTTLLTDYLFRYDRGAFWTGKYAFERFGMPFNRLTRFVLNPLLKTRRMYKALDASGYAQQYIVQDIALPVENAAQFMRWVDSELSIYPLWLCPLTVDRDSPLQMSYLKADTVMNVGVWGPGPQEQNIFVRANRALEDKVRELGGRKWLYAHAYYDQQDFWNIYDREWYEDIRRKYHAQGLPTLWDKVHTEQKSFIPTSGRRGVWRAMVGPKRPS